MNDNYMRWLAGSVAAVAGSALFGLWTQRRYEQALAELVPAAQRPESWVVDRPAEVRKIVQAVTRRGVGTVGVTTAVQGAGGFGKTTVARLVRADRRVLRRFDGRVYWVTLGRDVLKDGLLRPLNDLFTRLGASPAQPFTDVRQAAEYLASVLAKGPRRLLVLDDMWFDEQLEAFPVAGRCIRLVTTRKPSLVAGQAVPVRVDQMSAEEARRVLTADLPGLSPALVEGLLRETGRWPLLLRLTNRNLHAQVQSHSDVAVVAGDLLQRLRWDGPLKAAGHLPEVDDVQQLDVDDPDQRSKAVTATIEASIGLLTDNDRTRLSELAIFAEDETIPVSLVATLWQAAGGLDEVQTRMVCRRLDDLALLTLTATGEGGTINLHDVVGDYLHDQLADRVLRIHQQLLDAVAADLGRLPAAASGDMVVAWWQLPERARYLREHLVEHLWGAGRAAEAEALAVDLRWVQSRLQEVGPAGPFADLAWVTGPRAARLSRLLAQCAHLLTPTDPPHSLLDVLYSRVDHDPDWGPHARTLGDKRLQARLKNMWPLPDSADPALRRVITGHTRAVPAVAVARDGSWLASAGADRVVRVWDAATGTQRAELTGHTREVYAVAVAPDGTWLASAGPDRTVRLWDAITGGERATLTGHNSHVLAVAVAPDSTWLASASDDGTVRIWDAATRGAQAAQAGHTASVKAVAVAPDGTWLASANDDKTVRLWDSVTGAAQVELTGHTWAVNAVAIAPDGWLASASPDGTVRVWDAATGTVRATLTDSPGPLWAVAVAPDGTWLASAGLDGSVWVWDVLTGAVRTILTGHTGPVEAVAIAPDGTWLVSAGYDRSIRVWDAATGAVRAILTGHTRVVHAVAVAPNGTWLVSGSNDGTVRVWDVATGTVRAILTGHTWSVQAVALSPDGTWLASVDVDHTVRIWKIDRGDCVAVMRVDQALHCCAWSSHGNRITVGGRAGLYQFIFSPPTS
jgi:WD40 repeat protein